MRPDFRSLLDHDHAGVGRNLLEPDRRSEPGGARADNHDGELHRLAGGQILCAHRLLQSEMERAGRGSGATVTTNRNRSTPFTPDGAGALSRRYELSLPTDRERR